MKFKKIYRRLTRRRWTIGFLNNSIEDVIAGKEPKVSWISHNYTDRWFADPFILDVTDDVIFVLVEEFLYNLGRARIARLSIDRKSLYVKESVPILTLPTHLSYPAIIRKEGEVFIYPESGASGKLLLYKYDLKSNTLEETCVLSDENLGDATYTNMWGEDMLFCTTPDAFNGHTLHIYRKNANGLYKDSETLCFPDNVARMAGDFFEVNGRIYRPAQDCNKSYGNGTVIQEIERSETGWNIKETNRYFSKNKLYPLGMHTINTYKGVTVVDAVGYRKPFIGSILSRIRNLA